MKKRITYTMNSEKIEIPDIVNEKCNAAYEIIRQEAQQSPRKIHHKKKAAVIAVAAAVAIACSGTVAATYFRSAFNFRSHEVYTKDPAEKMDLSPFAEPVNDEKTQSAANITMQSVYCDGENLSIAFALTPNNEELKNMTTVSAHISSKLNGKSIDRVYDYDNRDYAELGFVKADDGVFYETMYYTGLDVTDLSELEINIYSLQGINGKHQTWVPNDPDNYYEAGCYEPDTTDTYSDKFDFKITVKPDTSNNRLYEINETQDGITLENVYITPFKTTVSISGLGERQQIRVVDQDGEQLEYMPVYEGEEWEWRCATPLKTAKQLSVQVWDVDMDDFPTLYEFTFDIEKGFADKNNDVKYDNSDIVYDPPIEEMDKHAEEEYNKQISNAAEAAKKVDKLPVNTPFEVGYPIFDETLENDEPEQMTIAWKITGSEIGDAIGDDISDDHWDWLNEFEDITPDNAKMLFVTYELTNMTDITGSMYTNGGFNIYSKDFKVILNEPEYISYKDNGGKSSYKYDFEPYQTKTITYGYIISEEDADQGFYVIGADMYNGTNCDTTAANILNGNIKLMEIK